MLHKSVYTEFVVDRGGTGCLGMVPDINRNSSLEQAMLIPLCASAVFPSDAANIAELGTTPATSRMMKSAILSLRTLRAKVTYVIWLQPTLYRHGKLGSWAPSLPLKMTRS